MLREATETLTWRIPNGDGSYGDQIVLAMPATDAEYLRDLWTQVAGMEAGRERSRLVRELKVHLDLRALFPGSEFVADDTRPSNDDDVPAYLRGPLDAHDDLPLVVPLDTDQATLLEVEEPQIGRWRPDQPDTARQAAVGVYHVTGKQRVAVLDAYRAAGERGLTDDELAREAGALRARTRRQELIETYGVPIRDSGRKRPSDAGNPAVVWILRGDDV